MKADTHPPFKTGVTSVTRVTHLVERPISLAFMPVTHFSDLSYTRCNAPPACNTKVNVRLLRAGALRLCLKSDLRWARFPNAGRGILHDSVLEILGDD